MYIRIVPRLSAHIEPADSCSIGVFIYVRRGPVTTALSIMLLIQYADGFGYGRAGSRLATANERRRYFVTTSLIGWAQAKKSALIQSL